MKKYPTPRRGIVVLRGKNYRYDISEENCHNSKDTIFSIFRVMIFSTKKSLTRVHQITADQNGQNSTQEHNLMAQWFTL